MNIAEQLYFFSFFCIIYDILYLGDSMDNDKEKFKKIIEDANSNLLNNTLSLTASLNDLTRKTNKAMESFYPDMAEAMKRHQQIEEIQEKRINIAFSDMDYYISNNTVKDKLELYLKYFTRICYDPSPLKDIIIKREGEEFFNNFERYFKDYNWYYNLVLRSEKDYDLDDNLNIMQKLDILKKRDEEEKKRKRELKDLLNKENEEEQRKKRNGRIRDSIKKEANISMGLIYYIVTNEFHFEKDEVMTIMNSIDKKQELEKKIETIQINIDKTPSLVKNTFSKSFQLKEKELRDLKVTVRELERKKAQERVGMSFNNIETLLKNADYQFCADMSLEFQEKIKELRRNFETNRERIPLNIKKDDSLSFINSTNPEYLQKIHLNNLLVNAIRYYEFVIQMCDDVFAKKFEQSQSAKNNSNISL